MFPIRQSAQMRRNDRTDRPLISRAVRLSTNIPENRTDIQARTASNAVERISLFRVGQQLSPTVVKEDNVKLLWSVYFVRLPRPADHGIVAGELLSCSGRSKHRQK